MTLNTFMIIVLIIVIFAFLIWYFFKVSTMDYEDVNYDNILSLQKLEQIVDETFQSTLRKSLKDMNLDLKQYQRRMANKEELKESIRTSSYGDKSAKNFVIKYIKDILTTADLGCVNPKNIDEVIPFNDHDRLKSRDKFTILAYLWLLEDREHGFSTYFCKYGLDQPKKTAKGNDYVVTKEDIDIVYEKYIEERGELSYNEKIGYVTQRVFESSLGLGAIDMLLETDIDEIQGGTSGINAKGYDIKMNNEESDIPYSFESIWIVFHGLNIRLECATFGTQQELERITDNIYGYNSPNILTEREPQVVGTMKNGNRIVVAGPPFCSDGYCFFCRKFDSTPNISLENLLKERNVIVPAEGGI